MTARLSVADDENQAKRTKKRDAIGKHLKDAYEDVVNEPLPDAFEDLLRQLDEKTDKDKPS